MIQNTVHESVIPEPAESELHPGWHRPQPETLPRPAYWPAVLALGTVLLLWGFITTFIISGVGLGLIIVALAGWIGGLRHGD